VPFDERQMMALFGPSSRSGTR